MVMTQLWRASRLSTVLVCLLASGIPAGAADKAETLRGYAEWRKGDVLIVEGQRARADARTVFRGKNVTSLDAIALGAEVEVKGTRLKDGTVLAREITAKPNAEALFEADAIEAADEVEANWLRQGTIPGEEEDAEPLGRILDEGPDVTRVRAILGRLLPPSVDRTRIRPYVVDNEDWNAMAMANGAIWVFTGLLRAFDDDEIAVVVGHEVAHVTHEHLRREMKKALWTEAIGLGIEAAGEAIGGKTGTAIQATNVAVMLAWQNGYSRDLEDQADRVGLRYAYEGGFDVTRGPRVWQRFEEKYGKENKVVNFFLSGHSRAPERKTNLEQQVAWNYQGGVDRATAASPAARADERKALPLAAPSQPAATESRPDVDPPQTRRRPSGGDEAGQNLPALRIRPGMTSDDVRAILGAPLGKSLGSQNAEWDYDDFTVTFENGKVKDVRFQ